MSQPFVKIINDKLSLVGSIPNGNPRVISILGKARMGKSTFLNAVVSHLRNQSQAPFKAMDCDDHCTRGIDAYHMEDHNLLLLDSQGLDYEDASHDPHLLLLLYILSDVIIFNDTRRLENGALKLMEPVCAFTNYLDIDTVVKPKLFFRIFDSDVKDATKNLEKVLGSYQDQYQSIRNSIKHLFHPDITLLKTEPLDKPAKIMLANSMYRELLAEPLGFGEAIQTILVASRSAEQKSVLSDVPTIIHKINSNQEIAIEKLDVVKLQAENDIHKWIQDSVPALMYSEMKVDGTQKCFEDVVEPRKNQKKSVLTAFTKRFKDVDESIRSPFYASLNEKLNAPIQKAVEESKRLARERIAEKLNYSQSNRQFTAVNSLNNSFSTIPEKYWYDYFSVIHGLEEAIQSIFDPIRNEIWEWIQNVLFEIENALNQIKETEKEQAQAVSDYLSKEQKELESWMLKKSEDVMTLQTVIASNQQFLSILKEQKMAEVDEMINQLTPRHELKFALMNKILGFEKNVKMNKGNPSGYDLVSKAYWNFLRFVDAYIQNKESSINQHLTKKKEAFLYRKLLPSSTPIKGPMDSISSWKMDPWTQKLISSNPEIQFIDDEIVRKHLQMPINHRSFSIMTARTHFDSYGKLYGTTLEDLVAKKLVSKEYSSKIVHAEKQEEGKETVINVYRWQNKYDVIVEDLFIKRLQKNFCKKTVEGFEFPGIVADTDPVKKQVHFQ